MEPRLKPRTVARPSASSWQATVVNR